MPNRQRSYSKYYADDNYNSRSRYDPNSGLDCPFQDPDMPSSSHSYSAFNSAYHQSTYGVGEREFSAKERLEEIEKKAARSNLTPNASEFVPKCNYNLPTSSSNLCSNSDYSGYGRELNGTSPYDGSSESGGRSSRPSSNYSRSTESSRDENKSSSSRNSDRSSHRNNTMGYRNDGDRYHHFNKGSRKLATGSSDRHEREGNLDYENGEFHGYSDRRHDNQTNGTNDFPERRHQVKNNNYPNHGKNRMDYRSDGYSSRDAYQAKNDRYAHQQERNRHSDRNDRFANDDRNDRYGSDRQNHSFFDRNQFRNDHHQSSRNENGGHKTNSRFYEERQDYYERHSGERWADSRDDGGDDNQNKKNRPRGNESYQSHRNQGYDPDARTFRAGHSGANFDSAVSRDRNLQSEPIGRNSYNGYRSSSRLPNNDQNYHDSASNSKSRSSMDQKHHYRDSSSASGNFKKSRDRHNAEAFVESKPEDDLDDVSRRDRQTKQLNSGTLDCLVCTEHVRQTDKVWNCAACYNVFHLKCIIQWAESSKSDSGWRCPACQNICSKTPQDYLCFCGKRKLTSEWNRVDNAHGCGEICGRTQKVNSLYKPCIHSCTLLCHPGPCPSCNAMVTRECGCGRTSQSVQCSSNSIIGCDSLCSKPLNCNQHLCQQPCHFGDCLPCAETYEQVCFCSKVTKVVVCGTMSSKSSKFSCGKLCNALLGCGNHKCKKVCHENECEPCKLLPDFVKDCCCGKTPLTADQLKQRESCVDPIPTCDLICEKIFSCGPINDKHTCKEKCHENVCPSCPLKSVVKCRCGSVNKEVNCNQLNTKAAKVLCSKKCTKKRNCGKHKCNQNCCIDADHICPIVCNRRLGCNQHLCELLCHRGNCLPCSNISFEELSCHCGDTVTLPPIPCGTRPPLCNKPCRRQHDCDHEPMHNCHSGATCPPCPVLTTRKCFGNHETRNTIPCHLKEFSCGTPCSKPLPCKQHKCIKPCHKGPCTKGGKSCSQPCPKPRALCRHPCGQACHSGSCPKKPCRELVKVSCQCGHRTSQVPCFENNSEYEKIISTNVIPKSSNLHFGLSMELGDVSYGVDAKHLTLKTLECNSECELVERNRKLAIGLQIRNPDLSAKLAPRYSDFMMQWYKKNPQFCQHVHDKLTDLVQLAKQSKQKTRSYSFEVMNRDKRQFVHEYCEHFGVQSVAYDAEPKRNIVATASKDTAWLPSYSLMEVMQRQSGQRKIHVPALNAMKKAGVSPAPSKKNEMQSLQPSLNQSSCWTVLSKSESVEADPTLTSTRHKPRKPDYFSDDL